LERVHERIKLRLETLRGERIVYHLFAVQRR
jgi:hypothetical protein